MLFMRQRNLRVSLLAEHPLENREKVSPFANTKTPPDFDVKTRKFFEAMGGAWRNSALK